MHFTTRATLVLLAGLVLAASAQAADPLYLQPPYDEIKLDEDNGGVVLRVRSLDLPGRRLPSAANRTGDLEIELLDRPGERFALPWANVASVRLFEQLVLFDPARTETIDERRLHSRAGYDPFHGRTITGVPVLTLARGEVVARNGELLGRAGRGQHVLRHRRR